MTEIEGLECYVKSEKGWRSYPSMTKAAKGEKKNYTEAVNYH